MDILNSITAYLTALVENRIGLAILVGLIFSLALTQWFKFVLLHYERIEGAPVWIIRAAALPLGVVPTYLILPDHIESVVRFLIGVSVGASAPYVYQFGTAMLYRLWPSLEARLSVDPYGDK